MNIKINFFNRNRRNQNHPISNPRTKRPLTTFATATSTSIGLGLTGLCFCLPISIFILTFLKCGVVPFEGGGSSNVDTPHQTISEIVTTLKGMVLDLKVGLGTLDNRIFEYKLNMFEHRVLISAEDFNAQFPPDYPSIQLETLRAGLQHHSGTLDDGDIRSFLDISIYSLEKVVYVIDKNICLLDNHLVRLNLDYPQAADSLRSTVLELRNFSETTKTLLDSLRDKSLVDILRATGED